MRPSLNQGRFTQELLVYYTEAKVMKILTLNYWNSRKILK